MPEPLSRSSPSHSVAIVLDSASWPPPLVCPPHAPLPPSVPSPSSSCRRRLGPWSSPTFIRNVILL